MTIWCERERKSKAKAAASSWSTRTINHHHHHLPTFFFQLMKNWAFVASSSSLGNIYSALSSRVAIISPAHRLQALSFSLDKLSHAGQIYILIAATVFRENERREREREKDTEKRRRIRTLSAASNKLSERGLNANTKIVGIPLSAYTHTHTHKYRDSLWLCVHYKSWREYSQRNKDIVCLHRHGMRGESRAGFCALVGGEREKRDAESLASGRWQEKVYLPISHLSQHTILLLTCAAWLNKWSA